MDIDTSLEETGQVVLDASGNGTVVLRPSNAHERWVITNTVVRVSTAINIPNCVTFAGSSGVTGGTPVDTTVTGNNDSSNSRIEINPGSFFTVVWTGGDVGSTASVTVTGRRIQRR